MPTRIVLIGPPGVGKGTQAALLEQHTGAKPLSSGHIFRAEIEANTELGELAKTYIDHGQLVPNGVTIQMVLKRLRSDEVRRKGFILDGFPRTVRQAEALTEEMINQEHDLDGVISLEAATEVVMSRLGGRIGCTKCGEIYHEVNKPPKRDGLCDKCNSALVVRDDDNPEAIRKRLEAFNEATQPVLEYYRGTGQLFTIDAGLESPQVFQEILRILQK